jgi:hypothetical protein
VKIVVDEGRLETFPRDDQRYGTAVVCRDAIHLANADVPTSIV